MLGYFGYTVWLTYISLISGVVGIFWCFQGDGHPYIGMLFLLLSGLCDAFDGKVARTKKNRTDEEKKYGIQIDSLSDLVAFGVLPASIGAALYRVAGYFNVTEDAKLASRVPYGVYVAIFAVYVLAALVRLAYFNVTEEQRQKKETGARKVYMGLPVTSAALLFPTFLIINHLLKADITVFYYPLMLLVAILFVSKIQIKKPSFRGVLVMIAIGAIEFALILIMYPTWSHGL